MVIAVILFVFFYLTFYSTSVSIECDDYPHIVALGSRVHINCKLNRKATVFTEIKTPNGVSIHKAYDTVESFSIELNVSEEGVYEVTACARFLDKISCWNGSLLAVHKSWLIVDTKPNLEDELVLIKVRFNDSRRILRAYLKVGNKTVLGSALSEGYVFNVSIHEAKTTIVAIDEYGFEVREEVDIGEIRGHIISEFAKELSLNTSMLIKLYQAAPEGFFRCMASRPLNIVTAARYVEEYGCLLYTSPSPRDRG